MNESPQHNDLRPIGDDQVMDWALGQLQGPQREQVERELAGSPQLRAKADAVRRTLAVLRQWPAEEPDAGLAERICQRVEQARQRPARRAVRPSLFSLAEIAAVAASLLLMALLFVPGMIKVRAMQDRNLCEDNMRQIGVAMGHYANENANMLPFMDLPAGANWLDRQDGRRPTGTAPLFMLVRSGKIHDAATLVCPATKDDRPFNGSGEGLIDFPDARSCSYSFQNLFGAAGPIRREPGRIVPVLADRNPLFRTGGVCTDVSGDSNSLNHRHDRGQNVLYNDGRVRWESNPYVGVNRDNIWLAGSVTSYQGVETSQGPDDAFLAN